jgi:hypothetical protein
LKHWDNLKAVPADALKPINFGKLKGKSDINPQWRYEVMTQEFGPCGIGWKYEIASHWTQAAPDGQVMLFVQVNLSVYDKEAVKWSDPIPAIGGDFLLEKDKNGLHGNDEAYKMATTDALGAAMKMLGVAADVYRGLANDSKYGREQAQSYQQPAQGTPHVQPATEPPQSYGFIQNEFEIGYYMQASGFTDIAGYVRQRFQREPAQLTVEECYGLAMEFYKYFNDKQGGQQ